MAKAKQIFGGQTNKDVKVKPTMKGPESKKDSVKPGGKVENMLDLIWKINKNNISFMNPLSGLFNNHQLILKIQSLNWDTWRYNILKIYSS